MEDIPFSYYDLPSEGVEAVYRALDPYRGLNPGFLRQDANTHIIVYSAQENEPAIWGDVYSWQMAGIPLEDLQALDTQLTQDRIGIPRYLDGEERFFPLLGNSRDYLRDISADLRVHAVTLETLDGDECSRRRSSEEVSEYYPALATLTGGTVTNLCDDGWTGTIDALGLDGVGLDLCFGPLTFQLNQLHAVLVDDVPLESGDYNYVQNENSICLSDVSFAPYPSVVRIEYE